MSGSEYNWLRYVNRRVDFVGEDVIDHGFGEGQIEPHNKGESRIESALTEA
jgi:hypothetical protein